jgi:hypothetical protein
VPERSWERRQHDWPELFALDFFAGDGSLGGFLGLAFQPDVAWYWAALVGDGRPFLLVRDAEVAPPRSQSSLEIRAEGLWADNTCETPFDHWSYGLEAFGVSLDDPDEALGAERGDRTALGFDLEWEATGGIDGGEGAYAQPGIVHGDVLVGSERLAFDGLGWRRHEWGGISPAGFVGVGDDGKPIRRSPVDPADMATVHRAPLVLPGGVLDRLLGRLGGAIGWAEWLRPNRHFVPG